MKKSLCILLFSLMIVSCTSNANKKTSQSKLETSSSEMVSNISSEISQSVVQSEITSDNNSSSNTSSSLSSIKSDDEELIYVNSNLNYKESNETIINPECGFYYPKYLVLKQNNNSPITIESSLKDKYSIIHLRVGLEAFSKNAGGSDLALTDNALNAIRISLENIKKNNMSCVIRFSYNSEGLESGGTYLEAEPSILLIKQHIEQVCTILNDFVSSILIVESGMIGPWGEQHSTSMANDESAIVTVMDTFLNNLNKDLSISVRYPKAFILYAKYHGLTDANLQDIHLLDFSSIEYFKRIGMFDDGYMANYEDYGTYTNRENEVSFLYKQGQYAAFGGEVITGVNGEINSYNTSSNVIDEAYRTHTTYLNELFNKKVIDTWKNEPYDGNDEVYKNLSGYDYLKNHFGYRFIIRNVEISENINSLNHGKMKLRIENRGFANLYKDKKVELILSNGIKNYKTDLSIDLKEIKSLSQIEYEIDFNLPSNISDGDYSLYLKITSDGNEYLPIRFANENIYDKELKANYLGKIHVVNALNSNGFLINSINKKASLSFYDVEGGKLSSISKISLGNVTKQGSLITLNETNDIANVTMRKGSYSADNYIDIEINNYQSSYTQMELTYYTSDNITLSAYEGTDWEHSIFYKHIDSSGTNTFSLDISSSEAYINVFKNKASFILRLFLGHDCTLNNEMNFTLKNVSFYNPNNNEKVSITYKGDASYLGSEFYQYLDKGFKVTIKQNYFICDNKTFVYYVDQNNDKYYELSSVEINENIVLTPVFN